MNSNDKFNQDPEMFKDRPHPTDGLPDRFEFEARRVDWSQFDARFPAAKANFEAAAKKLTDEEIKAAPDLQAEYKARLLKELTPGYDEQADERASALNIDRALAVLSLNRYNISNAQADRVIDILNAR